MPATPSRSAVEARALTKSYRSYRSPWHRLFERLSGRTLHRRFDALNDVTFDVPRGEGFGIVGENGAGKSTLLKILAGITTPTAGSARAHGKVASILELGSAFHPELTGRQNIVLNAAMLGLDATQVRRKTPEIVEFSELGDFIDRPVKTYSSGMAMRLGFAIATQVEPDVLIIDEALSVGDGYFQKKCVDRLLAFTSSGGTLLLCSHAMYYVSAFCSKALWLREGKIAALGEARDVVRRYEEFLLGKAGEAGRASLPEEALPGPVRILDVSVEGGELVAPGGAVAVSVTWQSEDPALATHVGVGLNRADEIEVCSFSTFHDEIPPWEGRGPHHARLLIPELPLIKGSFVLYVFVLDAHGLHIYDRRILRDAFAVESAGYSIGLVQIPHAWDRAAAARGSR